MRAATLEILSAEVVDQAIADGRRGSFDKAVYRAVCPSGRSLGLVRKRLPGGQPRAPLVLIHGWGQNRYSWHLSERSFVNYLAERGFDVWNVDLTGHGRSRELGSEPPIRFEDYVQDGVDTALAVHAESASGPVFLLGHSLGGTVCYAVAPRIPELLGGVVTFAGLYTFGRGNPTTLRIARLARRSLGAWTPRSRFKLSIASQAVDNFLGLVDDWFWSFPLAGWYPGSVEPHLLRERIHRGLDWTAVNILLTMLRWADEGRLTSDSGHDYGAEFAALDKPLLVIAGDADRMLPMEDARPAWEESRSSDKTFKLLSPEREATHWGHLDILLGRQAPRYVWPLAAEWIGQRCGEALAGAGPVPPARGPRISG